MAILAFQLPLNLSESEKREYYFYPDTLFYDLSEEQYHAEWNKLRTPQSGYLIVKEGKLFRANFFQFLLQTIKGWFGYENAFHPAKVQMAAMKFCYFGYLNGYQQHAAIQSMQSWEAHYQISSSFLDTCKLVRTNKHSLILQQKLLGFYHQNIQNFLLGRYSAVAHDFGQSYVRHREWNAFAALDPQSQRLIATVVRYFPQTQETLPQSTCRSTFAKFQLNLIEEAFKQVTRNQTACLKNWHVQVDELLKLCPELKSQYIDFIIQLKNALAEVSGATERSQLRQDIYVLIREYYSEGGMCTRINTHKKNKQYRLAFLFIEVLAEQNMSDAVTYIAKNHHHFYSFLQPGLPLSQAYAKALVKTSQGLSTLFGRIGASKYQKQALAIDPSLAYQDCAAYHFQKLIKQRKWDEAWRLLQQRRILALADDELNISDRRALADYYLQTGDVIYQTARVNRSKDFQVTEEKYHESLAMMACAAEVLSEKKYLHQCNLHRRLCAQIILDADKHGNRVTIERLELALAYIDAIDATPCGEVDPHLLETHILLLEEKVQQLHQLCLNPDAYESGSSADREHKSKCQQELAQLMISIDKLIILWKKMPQSKLNPRLAAIHFLKAECMDYFELPGNAGTHYKLACDYAPNEPYYGLRHAEFYGDTDKRRYTEESSRALGLLPGYGKTARDYMEWFDARWLAKPARMTSTLALA